MQALLQLYLPHVRPSVCRTLVTKYVRYIYRTMKFPETNSRRTAALVIH